MLPTATTCPVALILPPSILPVTSAEPADNKPAVFMLAPVMFPLAVIVPAEFKFPTPAVPVIVAVPAATTPAVVKFPPDTLPVAVTRPPVFTLPAVTLPVATTALVDLSNVNAVLPVNNSSSLNCIVVLAPPASMLPTMLPIKYGAVMLPVATTCPGVFMLPAARLPVMLPVAALTSPVAATLPPDTLPVAATSPAVLKLAPVMLPVADTCPLVVRLLPATLPVASTRPAVVKFPPDTLPVASTRPPVTTFPPVTLPVAVTRPVVTKLAPDTLPLACTVPPDKKSAAETVFNTLTFVRFCAPNPLPSKFVVKLPPITSALKNWRSVAPVTFCVTLAVTATIGITSMFATVVICVSSVIFTFAMLFLSATLCYNKFAALCQQITFVLCSNVGLWWIISITPRSALSRCHSSQCPSDEHIVFSVTGCTYCLTHWFGYIF